MMLGIYRGGEVNLNVKPNENSKVEKRLNGQDTCQVFFESITAVDIAIGDYITVDDKLFTLNLQPKITKTGNNRYVYECCFEGRMYELGKILYYDGINSEFFLTGDLEFFIDLIITNLNRVQTGWTKGTVQSGTETKNLQFSNENCLAVLQRLCGEYNLDFLINEDKSIDVGEFGTEEEFTFSYGRKQGLYSLTRKTVNSKNIITRLFPYGSERNIPANYRNYARRLKLAAGYIEENTETYGILEAAKIFEDIYPRFQGSITYIGTNNVFRCSTIDFDLNDYLVVGVSAKVHFNTGDLAGYEFELSLYNNTDKEITLKYCQQEKVYQNEGYEPFILPNDSIKPAIGDEFVFLDITMPDSYITNAEAELLTAAEDYLGQNSSPRVNYDLEIDPLYIQENSIDFGVGDYLHVIDSALGIDKSVRVIRLTKSILEPVKWDVELADTAAPSVFLRIIADIEDMRRFVVVNKMSDIARAYRNWKTSVELRDSIFDPDGYFDMGNIKPLSVETAMLSVGTRAGNFTLSSTIVPNYTNDNSKVKLGAGALVHFQIEPDILTWTMSENIVSSLDSGTSYYIYAKCSRTAGTGVFLVDTVQRKVDSDPDYYYFPIGILTSVIDGWRDAIMTYGQSYIVGRQMNVGSITGQNGLIINLDTGEVTGKIIFSSGHSDSEVEELLDEKKRVFITTPVPPYDIGDLWVQGTSGDLRRCSTAKAEGQSYSSGDWVVAVKYTDDTIANTKSRTFIQTSAPTSGMVAGDYWLDSDDGYRVYVYRGGSWQLDTAQSTADTAATNAQNALNQLGPIVSDNYLSKGEKPAVKLQYDCIIAEQSGIDALAVQAGVIYMEKTNYDNAVSALTTYLTGLSPSYTDFTQDTVIVGTTFNQKFKDVYDTRQILLNKIAEKPDPVYKSDILGYYSMDEISGSILEDHVGGENGTIIDRQSIDGIINGALNCSSTTSAYIASKTINQSFTISFWVKCTGATWPNNSYLFSANEANGFELATVFENRSIQFKVYNSSGVATTLATYVPTDISNWHHCVFCYNGSNGQWYIYWDGARAASGTNLITRLSSDTLYLYIGKGSATSPCGAYIDEFYLFGTYLTQRNVRYLYELRDALAQSRVKTVIDGGVVTTGRLEVGAGILGNNNAGVNGSGSLDTDIRFWAGSEYANRASAPFRVQQDGAVVMTKATVQSSASGERVVIDGTNNRLDIFDQNGYRRITVGDFSLLPGKIPCMRIFCVDDQNKHLTLTGRSFEIYENYYGNYVKFNTNATKLNVELMNLPQQTPAQNGNLRYLYVDQVTGQVKHH